MRRELDIRFSRDVNGSGDQAIFIRNKDDKSYLPALMTVYFSAAFRDQDFLYEADLFRDQRKDYEPTVNHGKHKFRASRAFAEVEWDGEIVRQWRSDIDRLSRSAETLKGWIEADLEMLVTCGAGYFCFKRVVYSKSDLSRLVEDGVTLEELKARLRCSKCGARKAKISSF